MKEILIAVRYSVITSSNAWASSRVGKEEYISRVLSPARLSAREEVFEKIVLASIRGQQYPGCRIKLLILVSNLLPRKNYDTLSILLKNTLDDVPFLNYEVKVINSEPQGEVFSKGLYKNINDAIRMTIRTDFQTSCKFATIRLDDDDGLSFDFCQRISQHMDFCSAGTIVSLAYGFEGRYSNGEITDIKHLYFPKNAQGLAYINEITTSGRLKEKNTIHIYNTGNHTRVDEYYPVLVDAREPAYFRTLSATNDSGGTAHHNLLASASKSKVNKYFPCLKAYTATLSEDAEEQVDIQLSKACSPGAVLIKKLNKNIDGLKKKLST